MIKNHYIKIFLLVIVILASYTLPQIATEQDKTKQQQIYGTWKSFDHARLKELVDNGDTVFVAITADWCITCKYNDFMTLNRNRTLNLFQDSRVHAMKGDITNHNPILQRFMMSHRVVGIPLYVMYGPSAKDGVILPILIDYGTIKQSIKSVQ